MHSFGGCLASLVYVKPFFFGLKGIKLNLTVGLVQFEIHERRRKEILENQGRKGPPSAIYNAVHW